MKTEKEDYLYSEEAQEVLRDMEKQRKKMGRVFYPSYNSASGNTWDLLLFYFTTLKQPSR